MNKSKSSKKTVNIKNIFNQFCSEDKYWLDLIKKQYEPEAQFLYILAPCITYIYTKISDIKLKKYIFLEQDRKNIILQRVKNHWLHKIIMCCVLELNDAKELNLLTGETPEKRFESFIGLLADNNNRLAFFDKYVVLKEKIQRYFVQEVEALTEILTRLDKCFDEIYLNFNWKNWQYSLKNIQSSGDSHGSRNVCIIALTNNAGDIFRIVYKPRALLMDKAYHEFLSWLNSYLKYPLCAPKLLLKRDYGWCEFISNLPCKNEKQIKEYYQNLGNLLAVVYLLCGSDIHYENIIAYGKHPVIIDVECLFVPHNILNKNLTPFQDKTYSVLNTLILPCRVLVKKGANGIDISGFTNHADQETPYQAIVAEKSGTDSLRLIRKKLTTTKKNNIPSILTNQVNPIEYEKYVKIGFNEAYLAILKRKKHLLSSNKILNSFKKAQTRLVFRPTSEYAKLLMESYHPLLLRKKTNYQKYFSKWLYKNNVLEFLHASEIKQIIQGDIPAYYANVNSNSRIEDANLNNIDIKFGLSGYRQVIDHIKNNINENDLKIQNIFIEQSFICYKKNLGILQENSDICEIKKITSKKIQENSETILNEILETIWLRDDLLFWPQVYSAYGIWSVGVTTPWLYDGLAGIILIFGVASRALQNKKFEQFTIKCLKSIELYITILIKKEKNIPIGAFSGIGGILYLTQILSEYKIKYNFEKLKKQCFLFLEKYVSNMRLISISELDIISGMAGLLKVLINFKNTSNERKAFALADICVKNILKTYPNPSAFPKNHPKNNDIKQPLLGFSHGVSGIAWALHHYYISVKKTKKIHNWIKKALNYERRNFSYEHQNWPHFGEFDAVLNSEEFFPIKWCHGAIGIGLSRIAMYQNGWRDEHILNEIRTAIQTTLSTTPTRYLNLCHGSLGNIEFLKLAIKNGFLMENQYNIYFEKIIPYLYDSINITTEGHRELFLPGLMTGKVGAAYGLLKLVYFDAPSILLLDKLSK